MAGISRSIASSATLNTFLMLLMLINYSPVPVFSRLPRLIT